MSSYGLDTETLDGYARIIADDQDFKVVNNFEDAFNFLCLDRHKSKIIWTWNLRYDVQAILKHYLSENKESWRDIVEQIKDDGFYYTYKGEEYKIFYIENKVFSITGKGKRIKVYDIAQFYGWRSLESQSMLFLNETKQDTSKWVNRVIDYSDTKDEMIKSQKRFMLEYDINHKNKGIGAYCIDDASKTNRLAQFMNKSFTDLGISFDNAMSQAKVAENFIKAKRNYPLVPENIEHFHTLAQKCFHGGIFETLQRGVFDTEIHDYDLNSAYPTTMAKLPHWANGTFTQTEIATEGTYFGWYIAKFNCKWIPYDDDKEPIIDTLELLQGKQDITLSTHRVLYPEGERTAAITRIEYDFMIKHNYPCEIIGGIEWHQTSHKHDRPFGWVPKMYNQRLQIKQNNRDDMRQMALKIVLNSSYGKTAQQKHGIGCLTNFFYASYITADTRIKLAEVAEKYPKHVIDIATDGICLDCEVKGLRISDKLGEWDHQIFDSALFIGSGMRQMFHNNTYTTYVRGFTNDRTFNLLEELEKNKNNTELTYTKSRPLQLGECYAHNKLLDVEDINVFTDVTKRLRVNTDKKHNWSRIYNDIEDFLESKSYGKPLIISDLIK